MRGPPPGFPSASPVPGIDRHLSGPIARALSPPLAVGNGGKSLHRTPQGDRLATQDHVGPYLRYAVGREWYREGLPPPLGIFVPLPLARALDSLVRVSRRVEQSRSRTLGALGAHDEGRPQMLIEPPRTRVPPTCSHEGHSGGRGRRPSFLSILTGASDSHCTLFSEFLATFPRGTCSLAVCRTIFSLGWCLPPDSDRITKRSYSMRGASATPGLEGAARARRVTGLSPSAALQSRTKSRLGPCFRPQGDP